MIWFVSDPHGGQDMEGLEQALQICTKDDLLIILGDMELHFRDTEENRKFSEYFEALECNIAFIDGNHENFDYLEELPVEDWCGGKVHRLSDNIVHLMRGHVFEIEGKTFLTMGGCKSTQKWKDAGLWWPQEDPNEEEIALAYRNLEKYDNKVDYILTHYCKFKDPDADPMTLQGLVNYIEEKVAFKHWYSGHWHKTKYMDERHTVVFQEPIKLS